MPNFIPRSLGRGGRGTARTLVRAVPRPPGLDLLVGANVSPPSVLGGGAVGQGPAEVAHFGLEDGEARGRGNAEQKRLIDDQTLELLERPPPRVRVAPLAGLPVDQGVD